MSLLPDYKYIGESIALVYIVSEPYDGGGGHLTSTNSLICHCCNEKSWYVNYGPTQYSEDPTMFGVWQYCSTLIAFDWFPLITMHFRAENNSKEKSGIYPGT